MFIFDYDIVLPTLAILGDKAQLAPILIYVQPPNEAKACKVGVFVARKRWHFRQQTWTMFTSLTGHLRKFLLLQSTKQVSIINLLSSFLLSVQWQIDEMTKNYVNLMFLGNIGSSKVLHSARQSFSRKNRQINAGSKVRLEHLVSKLEKKVLWHWL